MKILLFCLVGGLGFLVDLSAFWLLNEVTAALMANRLIAFWLAASATYLGNSFLTFKQSGKPQTQQYLQYMALMHVSGSVNLLSFWWLSGFIPTYAAFVTGILLGLVMNYLFSACYVFKPKSE
jgi:putative flippase GtrA